MPQHYNDLMYMQLAQQAQLDKLDLSLAHLSPSLLSQLYLAWYFANIFCEKTSFKMFYAKSFASSETFSPLTLVLTSHRYSNLAGKSPLGIIPQYPPAPLLGRGLTARPWVRQDTARHPALDHGNFYYHLKCLLNLCKLTIQLPFAMSDLIIGWI